MLSTNRLAVNPGTPEDHTILKCAPILCPPFQQNSLLSTHIPRGELNPKIPDVREVPEHLCWRVLRELREQWSPSTVRVAHAVERLDDCEEHQLEEVREDVPRLGRGQVESVLGVAVDRHDAVNLDIHIMDKGNKPTEALGHGVAPAERSHVLDLVQDQQDERIRQAVEVVDLAHRVGVDSSLGMHLSHGTKVPPFCHAARRNAPQDCQERLAHRNGRNRGSNRRDYLKNIGGKKTGWARKEKWQKWQAVNWTHMHQKWHNKSTRTSNQELQQANPRRTNVVPQSPPPQSRFQLRSANWARSSTDPQPKARPLAGAHPDPAPEMTLGRETAGTPPSDRARNSLNRVVLAQKGCKISPNRARLSSRRQLERRRASNCEAFCCESNEVRVYGTSSWGFPPSLFNSLERERGGGGGWEMQRRCWMECFSLLSLPPRPTRLLILGLRRRRLGLEVMTPLSNGPVPSVHVSGRNVAELNSVVSFA